LTTRRDETPFLYVGSENVDSIRSYEKLGFKTRRIINFAIVKGNSLQGQGGLARLVWNILTKTVINKRSQTGNEEQTPEKSED
jgi:hypothetical protein